MATVIALPYPAYSERPLKVLGADLSQRIRNLNHVRWLCARLDVPIESQDLRADPRPCLRIARPSPALLRHAECVRDRAGLRCAVVHGVDVQWPQAAHAAAG